MPATPPRRVWDPAALLDATGMDLRPLARRIGVDPSILCRPLSDTQADRYCTLLGLHPAEVWGWVWWVA
jgi:lambda repressor-like predicted transcriptional regulator